MTAIDSLDVAYAAVTLVEYACFAFVILSGVWLVKVCVWDRRDTSHREHVAHHPSASNVTVLPRRPYDWSEVDA